MRKLSRPPEPVELQNAKANLTETYLAKPSTSVWRKDYIVQPIYESSNQKCAYCENAVVWKSNNHDYSIEIDEDKQPSMDINPDENAFLHVDHFIARKIEPNKVVEWSNLIPACPVCNYKKGAHNVLAFPIINPYEDDPKQYFTIDTTLKVKCSIDENKRIKALKTITIFQFVDRITKIINEYNVAFERSLFRIFSQIEESIRTKGQGDNSDFNDIIGELTRLLGYGLPHSKYGAYCATIILKHQYYKFIKEQLVAKQLWSGDLQNLETQLAEISYE